MNPVVIFSPSRYSLYTTTVAEMLLRREVHVSALIVRRLFNLNRFRKEFRRDGNRLLRKIWRKLILREQGYQQEEFETIVDFRNRMGLDCRTVDEVGQKWKIPVVYCNSLNDRAVVTRLEQLEPTLVAFTGGGLIRKDVLDRSGHGILNCHMGLLPDYRGMDVVEWPLLQNEPDKVGITVHFMDEGLDTGDILRTRPIPPRANERIGDLRNRIEPLMCQAFVDTCVDFLDGKLERKKQHIEDGKQYFIMHPTLIALADQMPREIYRHTSV